MDDVVWLDLFDELVVTLIVLQHVRLVQLESVEVVVLAGRVCLFKSLPQFWSFFHYLAWGADDCHFGVHDELLGDSAA